ncbi:hypothetical protein BC827DRAFT_1339731 [Russula dissimulans]|nr:hypothetical protein BC827DRAFT_1339731 [Russula dissimulans]
MAFNIDTSGLVAVICEALLHGCYTFLFAVSVYLMIKRSRNESAGNRPIFILSIFLYLSCFTHFVLEFIHYYTTLSTTGVVGFGNETHEHMAADVFISVTDLIGQLILIVRCWLLWDNNYWVIILPTLCAIGGLACILPIPALLLHIDPSAPVAPKSLVPLGMAGYILPLCANIIVTILISVRIWYLSPRKNDEMDSARIPTRSGLAAINIVVESGMLYLAAQLTYVVLWKIEHPAEAIAALMAVQIYGIAPTLIVIRVSLGLSNIPSSRGSRLRSGTMSTMQPTTNHIRIGFSTSAFSESSQTYAKDIPMSAIKSKPSSGVPDSSLGSVNINSAV